MRPSDREIAENEPRMQGRGYLKKEGNFWSKKWNTLVPALNKKSISGEKCVGFQKLKNILYCDILLVFQLSRDILHVKVVEFYY